MKVLLAIILLFGAARIIRADNDSDCSRMDAFERRNPDMPPWMLAKIREQLCGPNDGNRSYVTQPPSPQVQKLASAHNGFKTSNPARWICPSWNCR